MLAGTNIVKRFGALQALKGVSLSIAPGDVSVVIGPSGSGKTTLIRAMSLLDPPTEGTIEIDGVIHSFPRRRNNKVQEPWPRVTVVFQQHFLWPHLTLRENIRLPIRGRADVAKTIATMIELFEMEEFVDRYPNQVSIGQRQRAALARGFALKPHYMLLDEITSALDVEQTGLLVRHLLALSGSGVGLVVVTHSLSLARSLVARCHSVTAHFLDRGVVHASGGPEFFAAPIPPRLRAFLASADQWGEPERNPQAASNREEEAK